MSFQKALEALEATTVPRNYTRKNVKGKDGSSIGMCLGLSMILGTSDVAVNKKTARHAPLARVLTALARRHAPDFRFTSIQVNKNNQTPLHVDRNNLGESAIVGLGDYRGGEVWVAGDGIHDCRNRFCFFDGNEAHGTMPFEGTRYTIVYFTQSSFQKASRASLASLRRLGFSLPPTGLRAPRRKRYRLSSVRLDAARADFERAVRAHRAKLKRRAPRKKRAAQQNGTRKVKQAR